MGSLALDWQQIVTLVIVIAAAVWLVRTQLLAPRGGGCGSCGGCGSLSDIPRPGQDLQQGGSQLVQIELELPGSRQEVGRDR